MSLPKVIIVGGGFGGLNVAKALEKADLEILLIDRTNHHLFQPLLYQVATASLSPGNIATPIRQILSQQKNVSVIMGEVAAINKEQRLVLLADGSSFSYDYLVLAPGASHSYFGNDAWEAYAPGLKTILDATHIRENILLSFERAERSNDPLEVAKLLRFVIVGGGPTGVEMAGSIAQIAHKSLFENFRKIKPESSQIFLIEGASQLLPSFSKRLGNRAKRDLEKMGVTVLVNARVSQVVPNGVYVNNELIEAATLIWAAGNQASPILKTLHMPLDRSGRVIVDKDLSVPGYPEVFVIGDAAHLMSKKGDPLPGIAPVAIQEGRYVAKLITKQLARDKRRPFNYIDKGMLATIGKNRAVGMIWKVPVTGILAWFSWSLVHIAYLVSFRNRLVVMMQWFFLYLTGQHAVRLIVQPDDKKENNQR